MPKKDINKKSTGTQFPRIYRTIPERWPFLLATTSFFILIIFMLLLSLKLFESIQLYRQISTQRQEISARVNSWISILDKYPGYSDAAFNIAVLYYRLNDFSKSRQYLEKALIYDPNYKDANKLSDQLQKRGF